MGAPNLVFDPPADVARDFDPVGVRFQDDVHRDHGRILDD
jgi:hypothetical protein